MDIGFKHRMEDTRPPWKAKTSSPSDVLLSKIPPQPEASAREHRPSGSETQVKISSSPRRSPQITEAVQSPARSVYASMQQMDSIYNQLDHGMRTTDFFDDSSDEDSSRDITTRDATTNDESPEQRRAKGKNRRSDPLDGPPSSQRGGKSLEGGERNHTGYQALSPLLPREEEAPARTSSSSLVDSIQELLPDGSSPPQVTQQVHHAGGENLKLSIPSSVRPSSRLSGFDQTLGAYAIAHDITLQALMRNEGMEHNVPPYSPAVLPGTDRESMLRRSFRKGSSPKSPTNRHVSSPSTVSKERHVTLPPIDITASRRSLPMQFVPTPFPFSPETAQHIAFSKDANPPNTSNTISSTESILTLSIRQSNPSSRLRITNLVIPASNDFSAVRSRSPRAKEQHFTALVFDDAAFFRRLQKGYSDLTGPWWFFSARSLQRIVISGSAMKQADRNYWVHPPRSPHVPAYHGSKDTFSQEKIMQHFRKPALGRSRYAFVHWAHRLAAARSAQIPHNFSSSEDAEGGDLFRQEEQPEGLEFVVSWSIGRISLAIVVVMALAVAALLLWTFLGPSTGPPSPPNHAGFRDAGDAVTTGIVLGICVLLLGLSGVAGWLGISWLVM